MYYAIDPPLVVNFEDGSAVRFLQITMEIMAHDEKAIDSVQKNIPLIRNNLAAADEQSQLPVDDVARRQGKTARRKRSPKYAPCRRRKAVRTWTIVLFTSFVVQ